MCGTSEGGGCKKWAGRGYKSSERSASLTLKRGGRGYKGHKISVGKKTLGKTKKVNGHSKKKKMQTKQKKTVFKTGEAARGEGGESG